MKHLFLTIFLLLGYLSSYSNGFKIYVIGSQWKFENHVELQFQFGSCDSLKLGKKVFRDIKKSIVNPLKPRVKFELSTGYLTGNIWHFNRDSAWLKDKGILKMIVRNADEAFPCSDTLRLQLIKLLDVKIDFSSPKYYFTELIKEVKVTLETGESKIVNADFEGNSNILQGIKLVSSCNIIKEQAGFGKANYRLPENIYNKDIMIRFIDKSSGHLFQSEKLQNTFYIRDYKLVANGVKEKIATAGIWGEIKLLSNVLDTLSFNRFESLNGGDGQNGFPANDAKDFKIRVERVNKIDSVAKIMVYTSDTNYIYLIDLFKGGSFTLNANGASGGWGGNAGLFGIVFYKIGDSVRIWKRGVEGQAGNGGNGGKGGNVTIEIDKFFATVIDKIKIENNGGKMGFGGVKNYPLDYNYPFYTGEGALLLKTWEKIFGYANLPTSIKQHLDTMQYYEGNPNLGLSGRTGTDGKTVIIYY